MFRLNMHFKQRLFVLVTVAIASITIRKLIAITKSLPAPELDLSAYWGPGPKDLYIEDGSIKDFKIDVSINDLVKLRNDLKGPFKFHEPLEGVNFEYGMNTNKLKEILHYWRDTYLQKWSERQSYLNSLPQYKTQIQGLNIHYIHAKPRRDTTAVVIPLLLLHGWPGSVREFYDIIPKLVGNETDTEIVFEVIAPSLPGFGWSDASSKQGLGAIEISIIFRNLMLRLGFSQFYVQGGDWGSIIGSHMTTLFPNNVLGYHSNFCFFQTPLYTVKAMIASLYPTYFIDAEYQHFIFPIMDKLRFIIEETGFFNIQVTKPDTIGIALTENPIGLAAYILEKFEKLYHRIPIDTLLDNLMIYYVTNSIGTSVRLYAESYSMRQLELNLPRVPTIVPTGCVRFFLDVGQSLDWQLREKYINLIHSTFKHDGSHFAAMETPQLLYDDFMEFYRKSHQFYVKQKEINKDEM